MASKNYSHGGYYPRTQTSEQIDGQYAAYPNYNSHNQNMYDVYYSNRSQYPQSNLYEQTENNWMSDVRNYNDAEKSKYNDNVDTIEISNKDLSPASYCSNFDLLLPDFYKSSSAKTDWAYGKAYTEFPSCSKIGCNQTAEKSVKYCSIQKPNCAYEQFMPQPENNFTESNAVFMPNLEQHTEESNDESDIIVEESDEDIANYSNSLNRNFNCIICNMFYSTQGSQFFFLTADTPLTMSTQKPVCEKLKHLLGDFESQNSYICSNCLSLVNTIDHLQLNLEQCKKDFIIKYEKTNNVHIEPKVDCSHTFYCRICNKTYSVKQLYESHLLKHKRQNRFLCEHCGKCFSKLVLFKQHKKVHGQIKSKKEKFDAFLCNLCNKPFRTRSNLKEHQNYCSGRLPFKCRSCNKEFATRTKLKSHIRLKHDKKFTSICSICNIGFVKMSDYKTHMVSHSTVKKFTCDKCEKSYKTLSNLNFHMKFHEGRLPFICSICSKGFMRKEYLEAHVNVHSGEKNFPCNACDKRFVSQKNLDAHLKVHDGNVKKKSCNICGKLISKGMEDHLRTHTNLKEFECDRCEMRFNTRNALLKHRKRKHEIEIEK